MYDKRTRFTDLQDPYQKDPERILSVFEERGSYPDLIYADPRDAHILAVYCNHAWIIRSHEGPDARDKRPGLGGMDNGFTIDHTVESGKLITLFSAPDYPQFQKSFAEWLILFSIALKQSLPRPQANPFYDFEEVVDSDQELDFASPSMETSP